ncbi:hypothetical protein F2Q68_00027601 [Brassica cretica]|uniref:Uncharacterized protein n=1 Tax=Brassica cretica TaxID=69181 RepID=A0A8S9I6H0_BRACR|nr:hypothetical protein F2Q68_00027601 [Brassica cretica]
MCPYSWSLWFPLARRCGLDPQQQWTDITTQLQSYNSRNWRGRLILLTWQCCISWTWQERNNRLHRNMFRSVDVLTRLIDRQIRDKILSYCKRSPRLSSKMMPTMACLNLHLLHRIQRHKPSLPFCLTQKLKRSSAENSRRPETLAVELSPLLSCAASLSSLSLSSPAPCSGGSDQISISSPLPLVSRSRSRLRWSVLNPSCSHVLYTPLCWS